MLTKIVVKNFKKLEFAEIELDSAVVFVGPNNSGKTSALQAIALWDLGMRKWAESRKKSKAKQRVGVTINRRDILAIPVPSAVQLWKDLHVRRAVIEEGKRGTKNIKMEISAEGFTKGIKWHLGFEFDYGNPESIYCRILKDEKTDQPMIFPEEALQERIGFLPPMSGLAAEEDKLEIGSIQVRIGEGRTAEVLRNLCWSIYAEKIDKWNDLVNIIKKLFGIDIDAPDYDKTTGRIAMTYRESGNIKMDLSNAGRGFHQILLLFSYIYAGQNTILLLDEPDAHLEIIRQKEIYNLLTEIIKKVQSQLIVATHSEAILNESAERDRIIAFLGQPHIVNNNSQLVKSLTTIGFDQYIQAKQKRWVLYLEGSTDLSELKAFAEVLNHPAKSFLDNPFVKYTTNNPQDARNHFYGLKEAVPELKGIAIFDRLDKPLQTGVLKEEMWKRREIENYIPIPEVIEGYIENQQTDLFKQHDLSIMKELIKDYIPPAALRDREESWWQDEKISEVLDKIFKKYFQKLNMPVLMDKSKYFELILLAKPEDIDPEIVEKLNAILDIAISAKP